MTPKPYLIGVLAGIAGGLMAIAAFTTGLFAVFFIFAAAAAIYIASMGWGTLAGIIAAVTAVIMTVVFGDISFATVIGLLLFAPAAWIGHLTNLGQPAEDGSGMVWYPLSAILLRLMTVLAAGFILLGYLTGYSAELLTESFKEMMALFSQANPDFPQLSDEEIARQVATLTRFLPIITPCFWLLMHVLTAFISAGITRRSGLLAREEEDVAATANLPVEAMGFMAAGLIGVLFLSGTPSHAAGVLLGLAIGGYGLVGLAQLHHRTKGNPARGFILGITYASIVMFTLPLFIFTVMGLVRSFSQSSSSGPPGGNTT